MTTDRFMAEWEPHGTVMLSWPHSATDWNYMLQEVQACYHALIDALLQVGEQVVLLAPENEAPKFDRQGLHIIHIDTNDTWIRDYGPLSLSSGILLDFRFNAWGQKFASNFDNQTSCTLADRGIISAPLQCHKDFVFEGGSIESDGCGTLLTTSCCLLAPNRNEPMTREEISRQVLSRLHARKLLWLECDPLPGDDTDGHIDTIARLAPANTIIYTVEAHLEQLQKMTNADGVPFNLVHLPMPDPIFDPDDASPLPATYANYLVTSNAVLMPTYNQPANDEAAMQTLQAVFPGRQVVAVDCRALIRQHGSLHCATMQVPTNAFSLS